MRPRRAAFGVAVYETVMGWAWTAYSQHGSEYGTAVSEGEAWQMACAVLDRLKQGPM